MYCRKLVIVLGVLFGYILMVKLFIDVLNWMCGVDVVVVVVVVVVMVSVYMSLVKRE